MHAVDCDKQGPNGATALNIACEHDQMDIVVALVNAGASLEVADNNGYTPLITAAQLGNSDIVQFLVNRGANVNARLPNGGTALISAVWYKRLAVVRILLDRGADTNLRGDFQNWSPLMVASISGYTELVQLIYEHVTPVCSRPTEEYSLLGSIQTQDEIPVNTEIGGKHRSGDTAQRIACSKGDIKTVKRLLLNHHDDINLPNNAGLTPLLSAIGEGHIHVAKILVENGAWVDLEDKQSLSPLMVASSDGHNILVKMLLHRRASVNKQNPDLFTALHCACQNGHVAAAKDLIGGGATVDTRDKKGDTPMHFAARNGHAAVVQLLLDDTALRIDCSKENAKTVKRLLHNHRDDINLANSAGLTPLLSTIVAGHTHVAKLLLENGACIDLEDKQRLSPLMVASSKGHDEVMKLLLLRGASVNKQHPDLFTALHVACQNGHVAAVKILIKAGATVDSPDKDGKTPLHLAASNDHVAVVQLLLDSGASIDLLDDGVWSSVTKILYDGNDTVMQLLSQREGYRCDLSLPNQGRLYMYAIRFPGRCCGAALSANDASIDKSTVHGSTALLLASEYGHLAVSCVRIDENACLDARDADGDSSLLHQCTALFTKSTLEFKKCALKIKNL